MTSLILRTTARGRRIGVRWPANVGGALAGCLLITTATLVLTPLGYVFQRAFANRGEGLREMWNADDLGQVIATTVYLAVGSVVVALVAGTGLAWFAHCLPDRRRWLGLIPLAPLILPQLALIVGFAFLFSPNAGYLNAVVRELPGVGVDEGPVNVYSVEWVIVITGLTLTSFVYLFVRTSLTQLNGELLDAAHVAGCSTWRSFVQIVLPVLRPALVYGALSVSLLALGQFSAPLLLGRQENLRVLTTQMYFETQSYPADYATASAYGMPILVVGIVFIAMQRLLLRNGDRFVTTSARGAKPLRRSGPLAQLCLCTYGAVVVALPLGALAVVACQRYWSADLGSADWTTDAFRDVLGRDGMSDAIANSVRYALMTCVVSIGLGYLCARMIYGRSRHPVASTLQEIVISLPLGIPSVIFGAGFLLAFVDAPIQLYGTDTGVVLVYVTILTPFTMRLILSAMMNLGTEASAAAAICGAGPSRIATSIELPLLRGALANAGALVIIITTHEFSASVLIRAHDTQVIGTVLYDLWAFGSYPETAVMALVMCGVTGVGVAAALLLGGRGGNVSRA